MAKKIDSDKVEHFKLLKELHASEGGLVYCLAVFGFTLAEREGYVDLDGLDAVRFYLMQKHNWLPRDVKAMSHEDLQFAMSQEFAGWTIPKEARL